MQKVGQTELYQSFIGFITEDFKRERTRSKRRMLNVFVWCFLVPAVSSMTILVLVKMQIFPRVTRNYLDWVILIFPVLYSLYILGSEVISQFPAIFRQGGWAMTLQQSLAEGEWREQTSEAMNSSVSANIHQWNWIITSFKMDLQVMDYRTKYLTALAGAVFFLIMQGIDSLTDGEGKSTWIKSSVFGWIETSANDLSQFVGLGLFLMLLYLSGRQTYQSLKRYLNCAELIVLKQNQSKTEQSQS